jgi:hypothetical protein
MRIPLPEINSDNSYTTEPSPMAIDADGANGATSAPVYAPKGYKPEPLDFLANAGGPGDWYGICTDNGKPTGKPVIQKKEHPMPGAFVSATSYERPGFSRGDPARYIDSNSVIYIVLPSHWRAEAKGIVLGCKAQVTDKKTGKKCNAAVIDFGPKSKIGEASIACAKFFGINSSPKNGGTEEKRFIYQFWPGIAADGFELQPV